MNDKPFWMRKPLEKMTPAEWEALCDGCARCCLLKLEDEDTREVYYTSVVCRLLDTDTCRCKDYNHRMQEVPTCVMLSPERVRRFKWLPKTCAYRLLAEGKNLPGWHPLVSGNPQTVHWAGISVRDRIISEEEIDIQKLEDYIIENLA